ncbi:T9SS type A sorting domain-containing protein [candidate division WOR-3 bacterium]|nr:T9SS type A sorting domain-containing protein [candidate division WOR-3 bacterium]
MKHVYLLIVTFVVFGAAAPGRPDAQIRNEGETAFIGENIYNLTGQHQTKEQEITSGDTAIFFVSVENDVDDGRTKDIITVRGTDDEAGWTVRYFDTQGGGDITLSVTTSGWATGKLDPHEDRLIKVELIASAPEKDTFEVLVTAQSQNQASAQDAVKAVAMTSVAISEEPPELSVPNLYLLTPVTSTEPILKYNVLYDCDLSIAIYDASGRKIETLVSGKHAQGSYTAGWDAGNSIPEGLYFLVLRAGDTSISRKVVLLR